MKNLMPGTKIARPRDGRHKSNSPKGWMVGELYGLHENISPKSGELNGRHENNSPKDEESHSKHENNSQKTGELNGRHENNLPKGCMTQR